MRDILATDFSWEWLTVWVC